MYGDEYSQNREYNQGSLETGIFPYGWGEVALRRHIHDPNVTEHGKAVAEQELAERAEMRARNRSW